MYFEIVLFGLVVLTGLVILLCKFLGVKAYENQFEPWYLDYSKSFFPVLLIVFLLRGFVVEPFRIPSGSMLPTLEVGDFILVNKYQYGLRLPVLRHKLIDITEPKRGDVMVFRYPKDNKTNYIKRIVGLPGDEIEYRHKRLYVNGELVNNTENGLYTPFPMNGKSEELNHYIELLPGRDHSILIESNASSRTVKTIVPEGEYFVLGDNRDHSLDSRYWGFVPDKNVVGKAFFVWFHYNSNKGGGFKSSRIGTSL